MAERDDLLIDVDDIRSIPGEFGLRRYRVFVQLTASDDPGPNRVGLGAQSITETELLVGGYPPKVKEIRSKDAIAGTVEYTSALYEIGPCTPEFVGGGITPEMLAPQRPGKPATTRYRVTGPGLPAEGLLCQRVDDDTWQNFRYMIRVRSTGRRGQFGQFP